jgi:hypothetical protein
MTSITHPDQPTTGTTIAPERSRRSVVGWALIAVVLVATVILAVAVFLPSGSSADSDPAPATSVAPAPDLVERWAESTQILVEACRRGEISDFRGESCPMPTAPGFRPGHQGGQPRKAH